jgi:hypothetical protein
VIAGFGSGKLQPPFQNLAAEESEEIFRFFVGFLGTFRVKTVVLFEPRLQAQAHHCEGTPGAAATILPTI